LIISIVKRGWGEKVLDASLKAGAEGGTIIIGRGVGMHEQHKILGLAIEPEKEIVLTGVSPEQADHVLEAICAECALEEPGAGIAFILPVERVVGVSHLGRCPEGSGPSPQDAAQAPPQ